MSTANFIAKAEEANSICSQAELRPAALMLTRLTANAHAEENAMLNLQNAQKRRKRDREAFEVAMGSLEAARQSTTLNEDAPDCSLPSGATRKLPHISMSLAKFGRCFFNLLVASHVLDYAGYVKFASGWRTCVSVCNIILLFLFHGF